MAIGLERTRRLERELERARTTLRSEIDSEVRSRVGELDRILARARADSSSQLAEQERALAETRRHSIAEAEQSLKETLAQMLAKTQLDVEERIESWQSDLGRSEATISREVSELVRGVQAMVQETRARIKADGERVSAESGEHRAMIARLREEMSESIEQALAGNQDELEKFANERRRAIQEIAERLTRREREVMERVEREETEIQRRIQAGAAEIERKQLEQLQRCHRAHREQRVRRSCKPVRRRDARGTRGSCAAPSPRARARRRGLRPPVPRRCSAIACARSAPRVRGKIEARMKEALQEMRERADRSWAALEKRVADFELELRARLEKLSVRDRESPLIARSSSAGSQPAGRSGRLLELARERSSHRDAVDEF